VLYTNHSQWNQYCVLDDEDSHYHQLEVVINSGTIILVVSVILSCPLLFIALYGKLLDKAKKGNNTRYFIWSFAIAAIPMDILITASDLILLLEIYPWYSHQSSLIFAFIVVYTVGLVSLIFINAPIFIGPMLYIKYNRDLNKKLPLPSCFNAIAERCNCICKCHGGYFCRECVFLMIGYTSFTWMLELLAYHIIYILLGAIVTPMETLATLSFYIAAYFSMVVYAAIVIKVMDSDYYQTKTKNFFFCIMPAIIVGLLFLGWIGCFMWYFHTYITLVQTYSTSQGIWHVIGSILPTIFSSIFVLWGKYILDKMKSTKPQNPEAPNQNNTDSSDVDN